VTATDIEGEVDGSFERTSGDGAETQRSATPGAAGETQGESSFWRLAAPVHRAVLLSGIVSGLGALVTVLPVIAAIELAKAVLPMLDGRSPDAALVWALVAGLVVSVAAASLLTNQGYAISHRADARFAEDLRQRQLSKLLALPLDWFGRTSSGRVKKAVQDDVAKVHQLIAHLVPDATSAVVVPVVSLAYLISVDWRLALIALVPLVCSIATFPVMMRDMTAQYERYNGALGAISGSSVEFVRGIAPIKVFAVEGRGHRRFLDQAHDFSRFYLAWVQATVHPSAIMLICSSPAFAAAVAVLGAGLLVTFGGLPPIAMLPALLLSANIAGPVFRLAQMAQLLREANGAAAELEEFFALPVVPEPEHPDVPLDGGIGLDAVGFSYPGGATALDGVTATLEPGTVTALVGPSGSGKSTLASLLPRLLDPDTGAVRLGGIDVREVGARRLYSDVGFVFQRPYLLRLSIRDNIALARPDATMEEVVAAATAARIHDRILRLPGGYDAVVGEGARLSGGEQQRLSIARALLMDTPLLVLDEATAFADPDSEAEIQKALAALTAGRTVLVIAHRLHTIVGADRILVLDGGRLVEHGTHDALVAAGRLYARMWELYQSARDHDPALDDTATTTPQGDAR